MKNSFKLFTFLTFLAVTLIFSCNQGGVQYQDNSEDEQLNSDQNQDVPSSSADWIIVKLAGQETGKISKSIDNPRFVVNGIEYQSKLKGDKRKYAVKSGDIIAEVKYKDDAFKVRKPDGTLLWKIKLYDDKVKISDNEENLNPYEIKKSDSDKAKLKKNDDTLGEIKLRPSDRQIEFSLGSKSYYVEADKLSLAYGALLIEEIPEHIRYIIAVELMAKGK
jgi:hypothetical protein